MKKALRNGPDKCSAKLRKYQSSQIVSEYIFSMPNVIVYIFSMPIRIYMTNIS